MKQKAAILVVLLGLLLGGAGPDLQGDPDPAGPCRTAHSLDFDEMKKALYEGDRRQQLTAVDGAACVVAPFDMLPYLAALMGARDRQVAARASSALTEQVERLAERPTGFAEVIPGQASAILDQLLAVAKDPRVDLDIRLAAFKNCHRIQLATGIENGSAPFGLTNGSAPFGLTDEEPLIRLAAMSGISVPMEKNVLEKVAGVATEDDDPRLQGTATAIICENALAHGVTKPSKDLAEILKSTLADADVPGTAIASILSCVKRFDAEVRSDFVSIALSHPDPAIAEFWKSL